MSQQYSGETNGKTKCAYHSMNKFMYNWDSLLLPLSQNSYLVAKSLFLNNHDINLVYKSYLIMWSIDKSLDYVPTHVLASKVGRNYNHLIFKFFNTNKMLYEDYFIFVCIFMFYDISHIALLLLSMTNIFTSDYIKVEEISYFYTEYEIEHDLVDTCTVLGRERENKDPECPLDSYILSDFIIYLNRSRKFIDYIETLRMKLVKTSISRGLYNSIISKCNFFYSNPNCTSYPNESCASYINRKINGLPKPYYSEYGTTEPAVYSLSEIISVLRDRFMNLSKKKKEKEEILSNSTISANDLNKMIQLSISDKPVSTSKRHSLLYSNPIKFTPNTNHRNSVKSLELASKHSNAQNSKSTRRSIQVLPIHENK